MFKNSAKRDQKGMKNIYIYEKYPGEKKEKNFIFTLNSGHGAKCTFSPRINVKSSSSNGTNQLREAAKKSCSNSGPTTNGTI